MGAIDDGKVRRMRNLPQYKRMTDEEFERTIEEKREDVRPSQEFERRIEMKLDLFRKDYDLEDLKINDLETLRALIQALISLEDYEQLVYKIRQEGLNVDNVIRIDKVNKVMSDLRGDISKLQDDLKITRKIRKADQETSLINYIDSLKEKARKFHESRESYVYCPKCNQLLATLWTLYPDQKGNKLELVCRRELADGTKCGNIVYVNTKGLLESGGTNKRSIMPESML